MRLLLALAASDASVPALHVQLPPTISERIVSASLAEGMEPSIALDLAFNESHDNTYAVRHEGNGTYSRGLFQLNDATAEAMGVTDATDAREAIPASVKRLAKLVRKGGRRKARCWWVHGEYARACR